MTPTSITSSLTVRGNAIQIPVRSATAQSVVTSPPYLGQRVYGDSDLEVGTEETVADYVWFLTQIGAEIRRILKPDGLWWLNIGDKANGSGGAGGDYNAGGAKEGKPKYGKFRDLKFKTVQFLDVPGKVVAALQADNWRLRSEIIWDKGQDSVESLAHVRRPRVSHEKIFLLAPTDTRSTYYGDRLKEKGSVWHFPPAQLEGKNHLAPFPDELARRCIVASTNPGDLVVDPFVGSGTTTRVAQSLGRPSVGIDLYAGRNL